MRLTLLTLLLAAPSPEQAVLDAVLAEFPTLTKKTRTCVSKGLVARLSAADLEQLAAQEGEGASAQAKAVTVQTMTDCKAWGEIMAGVFEQQGLVLSAKSRRCVSRAFDDAGDVVGRAIGVVVQDESAEISPEDKQRIGLALVACLNADELAAMSAGG